MLSQLSYAPNCSYEVALSRRHEIYYNKSRLLSIPNCGFSEFFISARDPGAWLAPARGGELAARRMPERVESSHVKVKRRKEPADICCRRELIIRIEFFYLKLPTGVSMGRLHFP